VGEEEDRRRGFQKPRPEAGESGPKEINLSEMEQQLKPK